MATKKPAPEKDATAAEAPKAEAAPKAVKKKVTQVTETMTITQS